jgi:hypothetical protein
MVKPDFDAPLLMQDSIALPAYHITTLSTILLRIPISEKKAQPCKELRLLFLTALPPRGKTVY